MSMRLGMVSIATRRNAGKWFFPLMVGLSLLFEYSFGLPWNLFLWPEMSNAVNFSMVLIGPCIAGATAWVVAQEHRCHLEDLLITTPSPTFDRWMATWIGTSIWGVAAYTVTGSVLIGLAVRNAVWGGPTIWPMLVGLLAVPAYAALGCAAGVLFPGRPAAPITAIAVLMGEVVTGRFGRNIDMPFLSYLSPVAIRNASVWYGIRPNVALVETLVLLGLIGLGLGGAAWRADTSRLARGLLTVGLLLVTASTGILITHAPPSWQTLRDQLHAASGLVGQDRAVIPYTPACASTGVPVCMHPAYQKYLRADAATINRLLAPLRGIMGVPVRAMQTPGKQGVFNGTLDFILSNSPTDDPTMPNNLAQDQSFFGPIVRSLIRVSISAMRCPMSTAQRSCDQAQEAIGIWLVRQAGLRVGTIDATGTWSYPYVGQDLPGTVAVANRFAALPAARQHAWLRTHYLALRQGRVPLSTVP